MSDAAVMSLLLSLSRALTRTCLSLCAATWAVTAGAHGLDVVAQQTADAVTGLARYSDQSPAANLAVEVFSTRGGSALAEGVTDAQGRFRLSVPAGSGPISVVIEGEEGHRAEASVAALIAAPVTFTAAVSADALAAQQMLSLLREDIARLDRQIRFRDILGGIGYLVGLAGAVAWWMSRRRNE